VEALFVTSNPNKIREAAEILGVELHGIALDLPELQSLDLAQVAVAKAASAREALNNPDSPVLVEDSGLVFEAWNGLPGALTKWFLESVGNEGLLKMLSAESDRSARAVCAVAVATADGTVCAFTGVVEGEIPLEPRGDGGFGWGPIFVPKAYLRERRGPQCRQRTSIPGMGAWRRRRSLARRQARNPATGR
jgi:non-canonical purine NTP pyrophosphatase (RdgB/HAM1 family)